ncbi:hypothetical protein IJH23_00420 [Candidatus Saccharibacteria bacterium]|nr:hypothetical protein [Candidatus Saccharibacteria bacterium]
MFSLALLFGIIGSSVLVFSSGVFANDLTYQTSVPVEFTFNDYLNVTVSGDLVISDLAPGAFADSNHIAVTVNTNNAYGYTLSATVGDTNNASRDLRHSGYGNGNTEVFSNLDLDANLTRETFSTGSAYDNKWGFSTDKSGSTYSGKYNGLPLYSDTVNSVVLDDSNYMPANGTSTTNFWIGAKASSDKVAGTYTNVVNFMVVGGEAPMGLAESYAAAGKTKISVNGGSYYKMQDMNSSICANTEVEDSTLQVVDTRDNKIYWIAKLKDGNCWMTQNLDLDLGVNTLTHNSTTLYHDDTDLGWGSDTETTSWTPANATITVNASGTFTGWTNDYNVPYSADPGDWYYAGYDGTNLLPSSTTNYLTIAPDANGDIINSSNSNVYFSTDPSRVNGGTHQHVGNYYNWSAAVASNDTSGYGTSTYSNIANNPQNSICPAGWRLPTISNASNTIEGSTNEFSRINRLYNNASTSTSAGLEKSPLFFARGGYIYGSSLYNSGYYGNYWSSTVNSSSYAYYLYFYATYVNPTYYYYGYRRYGSSVRCLAR